jgi:hypothetical protein
MLKPIIVSPFATNVLDLIDTPLINASGNHTIVRRPGTTFQIYVLGTLMYETDDNIRASYYLNALDCSIQV